MGLKTFITSQGELNKDSDLRIDVKYHTFLLPSNWNIFNSSNRNLIALKQILSDDYIIFNFKEDQLYKGIPTGQIYLDEDGDIKEFIPITREDRPGRLKYQVSNENILISSLRLAKSPALFFEDKNLSEYVFSNGFYIFKVNKNWNKKFVHYILRTTKLKNVLDNHIYRGIGISAYKKDDLLKIKIPRIPKTIQDQIVSQIEPLEKKIKSLKDEINQPQEAINNIFAQKFGFDLKQFEEGKKQKFFNVDLSKIRTSLIRSTVIQNKTSSNYLKTFLFKKNSIFLKDILLKPIKRGKQPEYSEDGVKVIKTLNIQKGKVTFEEVQYVSETFLKNNKERAGIYQNDLLLTSTGMGRGKFALYEDNEICFADSHISIIRFNQEKFVPNFLNYYCQSFLGIEQLKYIEMQIKGTPEIYETQLNYFQILNISLQSQQKIVEEIKATLDKQQEIKIKIERERKNIDKIIEKSLR